MTLIVPNAAEVIILNNILEEILVLKLYSNNKVPVEGDTAASYTEVVGGGYSSKTLAALWTVTSGDPSYAVFPSAKDFAFTGVTNAPGTVYGYYIIGPDGAIRWAERFPEAVLPFSPINGSLIRITPRLECS